MTHHKAKNCELIGCHICNSDIYQNKNKTENIFERAPLFSHDECQEKIQDLETKLAILQSDDINKHIIELIHQRSIAFDEARDAREKLKIAIKALEKLAVIKSWCGPEHGNTTQEVANKALAKLRRSND